MAKIVVLYSDGKTVDRAYKKLVTCFPNLDIVPIVFLDSEEPKYIHESEGFIAVPKSSVHSFIRNFDFTGVTWIVSSFMTNEKLYFIHKAPSKVKVGWGIPGGDLYNRYLQYFGYKLKYTNDHKRLLGNLVFLLKRIVRTVEFRYLIKRLTFVSCCYCDYDLIKKYSSAKQIPNHIYSFAYPIDKIMGNLYNHEFVNGTKIIIGNSASKTNNHLYVLEFLKKADIGNYKISLQMSYGDSNDEYKRLVQSSYKKLYSNNVEFITSFVPLDEYNKHLIEGAIFLFGNWRQEAVGNILTAFYLGAKVYLSNKNPLFKEFRDKGFVLFELESLPGNYHEIMQLKEKQHNRNLCEELYNYDRGIILFKNGYGQFLLK